MNDDEQTTRLRPTGDARLTDEQLERFRESAEWYGVGGHTDHNGRMAEVVLALLADRAVLEAEITAQHEVEVMVDALFEQQAQEIFAMRPLVEALADDSPITEDPDYGASCIFCEEWSDISPHGSTCVHTLARAFVAQYPQATPDDSESDDGPDNPSGDPSFYHYGDEDDYDLPTPDVPATPAPAEPDTAAGGEG